MINAFLKSSYPGTAGFIPSSRKMPIVLAGNYSSKYEIEAVCKLFFHTARFRFSNDLNDAQGDNYIFASTVVDNAVVVIAKIRLNGDTPEILQKRVMENVEWKILPKAVALFCEDKIRVENGRAYVDE